MAFSANAQISQGDSSFEGKVENLSLKGLFVRTEKQLPLDEEVIVTLMFSGSSANLSLRLVAKVVRVSDDGIGLNFDKVSIDSLEHTLAGQCSKPDGGLLGAPCNLQAAV
jgi:hypothetical protein